MNAKLLILDEPTAALGGEETQLLFRQIERLKAEGVGIIYISHRLDEIRQIADRIVVMRDGSKVQEFDSGNVPVRTIVEAMVGRSLERMFPAIPTPADVTLLEVKDLCSALGHFSGVNFSVSKGEVFGIAGLVGAGRTELVRAITGADPIASGAVLLDGKDITPKAPIDAIRNGIVLVPEDRKLQGWFSITRSVRTSVTPILQKSRRAASLPQDACPSLLTNSLPSSASRDAAARMPVSCRRQTNRRWFWPNGWRATPCRRAG